ncbi:MAG: hypothetical protein ABI378_03845 [Chitinophagaceae bacterium]
MKKRFLKNLLLAMVYAVSFASCKKANTDPPAWFTTHSRFYYDWTTDSSNVQNYRLLTVNKWQTSADELFFYESIPDTDITARGQIFNIFGNGILKTRVDGLYSHECEDCNVIGLGPYFDYLMIPATPKTGESITQYGCARTTAGYNKILTADTVITVPAGTYHTFCILHENGDRSYWNKDIGIVMYAQIQYDNAYPVQILGTLKLRSFE